MKTTTIRADETLVELASEVARRQGTTFASLLRSGLAKEVDEQAKINPEFAAFVGEVARKRHAAVTQEIEATLGACAAAHFTGPLPPFPRPIEPGV